MKHSGLNLFKSLVKIETERLFQPHRLGRPKKVTFCVKKRHSFSFQNFIWSTNSSRITNREYWWRSTFSSSCVAHVFRLEIFQLGGPDQMATTTSVWKRLAMCHGMWMGFIRTWKMTHFMCTSFGIRSIWLCLVTCIIKTALKNGRKPLNLTEHDSLLISLSIL